MFGFGGGAQGGDFGVVVLDEVLGGVFDGCFDFEEDGGGRGEGGEFGDFAAEDLAVEVVVDGQAQEQGRGGGVGVHGADYYYRWGGVQERSIMGVGWGY